MCSNLFPNFFFLRCRCQTLPRWDGAGYKGSAKVVVLSRFLNYISIIKYATAKCLSPLKLWIHNSHLIMDKQAVPVHDGSYGTCGLFYWVHAVFSAPFFPLDIELCFYNTNTSTRSECIHHTVWYILTQHAHLFFHQYKKLCFFFKPFLSSWVHSLVECDVMQVQKRFARSRESD